MENEKKGVSNKNKKSTALFFFQQDFYIWEGRNNINNHQQKLYLPL